MFSNGLENFLPEDSLRARFARGVFWSTLGTLISQGLTLIGWVVVARMLGRSGFGELAVVQSTVGAFGVIAGLGLGLTATKHIAELRKSDPERAGRILSLTILTAFVTGGLGTIVLFIASPYIASQLMNAPQLTLVLCIGSSLLLFNTLYGLTTSALAGFESFKTIAKISLMAGLVKVLFMIVGVSYLALPGVVGALVAAALINNAIGYSVLLKKSCECGTVLSLKNIRSELPIIWSFSIPGCISSAIVPPVIWIAHTLLVRQEGGFAEMGLFNAASRLQVPLRFLGSTSGAVLLPILVSLKNKTNNSKFERANILIPWFLGALPAIVIVTFPEIISLIFGQQYSGASARTVLCLVMLYTAVIMYKQGLARVMVANNLMWWSVISNSVWAAVLLFSFFLLRHMGALGLALSFLLAYIANVLVFIPLYTRRNLVPKDTMVSPKAAVIWMAILCPAILSLLGVPLVIRLAVLLLMMAAILFIFWDLIWNMKRKVSSQVALSLDG